MPVRRSIAHPEHTNAPDRNTTATIVMYSSPMILPLVCFLSHGIHRTSDCTLVRKAHNSGRNHLANVRDYYACQPFRFL